MIDKFLKLDKDWQNTISLGIFLLVLIIGIIGILVGYLFDPLSMFEDGIWIILGNVFIIGFFVSSRMLSKFRRMEEEQQQEEQE